MPPLTPEEQLAKRLHVHPDPAIRAKQIAEHPHLYDIHGTSYSVYDWRHPSNLFRDLFDTPSDQLEPQPVQPSYNLVHIKEKLDGVEARLVNLINQFNKVQDSKRSPVTIKGRGFSV